MQHMASAVSEVYSYSTDCRKGEGIPLGEPTHKRQALAQIRSRCCARERESTLCDLVDEATSGVELAQGQLVVVSVIQHIQQVPKEGVHVVHLGKILQDLCQSVMPAALRELDLKEAIRLPEVIALARRK